nr:MAG TPA_asm: hypothetical protein [Caudoviricetes sp.]
MQVVRDTFSKLLNLLSSLSAKTFELNGFLLYIPFL